MMRQPMSIEHRVILKKNYVMLVNEMQMEYMLPYFIQEGVLTQDMVDEVRSANTSFMINDKFMQIIPHRGDRAYSTLLAALKYGSGQLHLMEALQNTSVTILEMETYRADRSAMRPSSHYSSCFDGSEAGSTPLQLSPRVKHSLSSSSSHNQLLQVPQSPKRRKVRKKKYSRSHSESLPGLSHLFPYVVPHVHKKWRIFAENLGLKDEDLGTIVEIPHGKQSRYAQSVLELWLNKDGTQASKSKLIQALEATGLKKALDAIAIYTVPKFKAKQSVQKKSLASGNVSSRKKAGYVYQLSNTDRPGTERIQRIIPPARQSGRGYLPIKCHIEKITSNTDDLTQKTFLNLADKITESMVEQGEEATDILNAMERLQGIVFGGVRRGSIILETQVKSLHALETLMGLYASKELVTVIEQVLVTSHLLSQFSATEVKLAVNIKDADYKKCHEDLLSGILSKQTSIDSANDTDSYLSADTSQSDTDEVFGEDNVWHDTLVLCGHMVADTVSHLQARMRSFDPHVSEFLMTLQRVHPPNITRVSNIEDLKLFRESLLRSAEHNTLSAETINAFINIHSDFISKVTALREAIDAETAGMYVSLDGGRKTTLTAAERQLRVMIEHMYEIERMLQPNYDFSACTHARTVQLTTLETLGYRGLLSYHHVIINKLQHVGDT